jgi:hypothetical protein
MVKFPQEPQMVRVTITLSIEVSLTPFFVTGPGTAQGKRTDYHDAQDYIKAQAEMGCKLEDLAEALPKFWAERERWVRRTYNKHRKLSEKNFFEKNEIFKWQKDLITYLNDNPPDPRRIVFVVDNNGDTGKSELARNTRHIFPNRKVFCIPPQDYKSMASLVPDDGVDIVILDCPHQKQYDLPYDFLEDLKNGSTVQTKYEVIKKEFTPPHVVVLMNRNPKTGKTILSPDCYVIIEIELEPEERERLTAIKESLTPTYISEHLPRTLEILETCKEEKSKKRNYEIFNQEITSSVRLRVVLFL